MGPQEREIVHIYPRTRARGGIYIMEEIGVACQRQSLYVARTLSGWQPLIPRKRNGKLSSFRVCIAAVGPHCLNQRDIKSLFHDNQGKC